MAREGEEWISGHVAGNAGVEASAERNEFFQMVVQSMLRDLVSCLPPPPHSQNDKDHGPSKGQ